MLAAPVESAPVEEPLKAPTPPPPAGNFNNYPFAWQKCVSGSKKIGNHIFEATYNPHTLEDQNAAHFLCLRLLSASCWLSFNSFDLLQPPPVLPRTSPLTTWTSPASPLNGRRRRPSETPASRATSSSTARMGVSGMCVCACVCVCTCPYSSVRGQIDSWLHRGRIRQAACLGISWDHF